MKQGRLILTLEKFSIEEREAFLQFVESPYFNTNKKALVLLRYVLKMAPDFEEYSFIAQKAEELIFEGKSPIGGFTKVMAYLARLSEKFIFIHQQRDDVFAEKFAVAQFSFERKEAGLYKRSVKELQKLFTTETQYDIGLYYDGYRFEEFLANCNFMQNPLVANENMKLSEENGEAFFLASRLRAATARLTQGNLTSEDKQSGMMKYILDFIEEKKEELPALVKVWHKAFVLANNPSSEAAYQELRQGVADNISRLDTRETYGILIILQNYLATAISSPQKRLIEIFELYKFGLKHELFKKEVYISSGIFNNIVTVSLKLGELEWAENFITSYEKHLSLELRENVMQYNQAKLAFEKQDFRLCKNLLNQLDYQGAFVILGIKRMQLKVYFELWEEELLENSLNAFRVYLHRLKKLGTHHKKSNLNFLNAVSTLNRFHHKTPTQDEKTVLIGELAADPKLHEQQWLIRKVEEF